MNTFKKLLYTENTFAALPLRLALGAVFIAHGAQKLFGWWGGHGLQGTGGFFEEALGLSPGIFWAAVSGSAEFFGGLLILLGALTRIGAGVAAINMAVALFLVHRQAFFLPEGMEFVLTLLAACIALLITGGGAISVDRALAANRTQEIQPREKRTM